MTSTTSTTMLGKYALGRTLGSGVSCKVKIGKNKNGQKYAVKILHADEQFKELVKAEVDVLKKLHHDHIVNFVEMGSDQLKKQGKEAKVVDYIVLELATGGELFDFVANTGRFTDKVARTYFGQLIDALKYMHSAGVCHRDLKPENIMLDDKFNLKVADFGFAAPTQGHDKSGLLHTQLGTFSYMAPEIHLGKAYTGQAVDLFAAAIILFIMQTQRPPFASASTQDPHYQLLAAGRQDLFWKAHEQCEDSKDLFTPEFKDLFSQMCQLNPKSRPTSDQILKHAWMQGPCASKAEILKEFSTRKDRVEEKVKKEQDARRQERANKAQHNVGKIKVRRGDGIEEVEEDLEFTLEESKAERLEFDPLCQARQTQFFSTSMCTTLFRDLVRFLRNSGINDFYVSKTQWKLKFEVPSKGLKITCMLLHVDMDKVCVEFTRRLGDQLTFFAFYQEIEKFMQMHNDATL